MKKFLDDIGLSEAGSSKLIKKSYDLLSLQTYFTAGVKLLETIRKQKKSCLCIIITSDKCYQNLEKIKGYKEDDVLGGIDPYSASKENTK